MLEVVLDEVVPDEVVLDEVVLDEVVEVLELVVGVELVVELEAVVEPELVVELELLVELELAVELELPVKDAHLTGPKLVPRGSPRLESGASGAIATVSVTPSGSLAVTLQAPAEAGDGPSAAAATTTAAPHVSSARGLRLLSNLAKS